MPIPRSLPCPFLAAAEPEGKEVRSSSVFLEVYKVINSEDNVDKLSPFHVTLIKVGPSIENEWTEIRYRQEIVLHISVRRSGSWMPW